MKNLHEMDINTLVRSVDFSNKEVTELVRRIQIMRANSESFNQAIEKQSEKDQESIRHLTKKIKLLEDKINDWN